MKAFYRSLRTIALAGLTTIFAASGQAQSSTAILTPLFISANGAAGNVTYTYQLFCTFGAKVQTGDILTIYDFSGLLTSGANTPTYIDAQPPPYTTTFSISVQNLGAIPLGTTNFLGDDPAQPNVTLTYNGTSPFIDTSPVPQVLGTLTLHSTNMLNTTEDSTAFASSTTNYGTGSVSSLQGLITGPNLSPPTAATPEPSIWPMFVGMGISAVAFNCRRKRYKYGLTR